uniref:protein BREAST CANCER SUSCEPTIBILITY 2 homolog B-like n=1 Tax=Erigeron canadensis TaxID=72917 RepID=UPI001CB96DCC|nr:protein BREAST CANCER SUSCEPTIBILITY 2 homolog B-like [Erigeron canadensis]
MFADQHQQHDDDDAFPGFTILDGNQKPGFRTGLGKPVVVKQSSLAKASSILVDQDGGTCITDAGHPKLSKNQNGTPPTFRTGLGKPIVVQNSSLTKASSILGDQGGPGYLKPNKNQSGTPRTFRTELRSPVAVKQSSLTKASFILGDQDGDSVNIGYPKLYENQNTTPPMFRTGSGKPVVLKQASLAKASIILGEQDGGTSIADAGYPKPYENQSETPSTFRTALGKPVVVKQSSLPKASSILGDQDGGICNADTKNPKLYENQGGTPPTFRTGLGKPVVVKKSSLVKASFILGDQDKGEAGSRDTECMNIHVDNNHKAEAPVTFETGSGKSVATKKSSYEKALSILQDDDDDVFSDWVGGSVDRDNGTSGLNTMFQTGSGKAVNICSTGLIKARALLGLEENIDCIEASKGHIQLRQHPNSDDIFTCQSSLRLRNTSDETYSGFQEARSIPNSNCKSRSGVYGNDMKEVAQGSFHSASRPPPIQFRTAGGRSVKVSSDALKRARSLLGDPDVGNFLNEGHEGSPVVLASTNGSFEDSMNKEISVCTSSSADVLKAKNMSNGFTTPLRSALSYKKTASRIQNIGLRSNLIKEFDAVEHDISIKQCNDLPCSSLPLSANMTPAMEGVKGTLSENGNMLGASSERKSSERPLVDIINIKGSNLVGTDQVVRAKRKLSSRKYISPFKKPRNSTFVPPLNIKSTAVPNGTVPEALGASCFNNRVSTRYPSQFPRKYIKEYLGEPLFFQNMFKNLPEWLRKISPENVNKHMFDDESGTKSIGLDSFFHMLSQSGCSTISKEWIANHYRWIVWKLGCYERCYPTKFFGKLLTAYNVLEELKYRYEREVNNGHRSALKRILEGDAHPSSPLVLCISSIHLKCDSETDTNVFSTSNATESSTVASVELTDGWYSVNGLLDELLLKQVVAGKLFVGQKLKVCGASLCGWNAPVSPLEASRTISLCLNINGTYRAHWAERLGFCKSGCAPLALKCIKGSGGVVPSTLVGVTRIYPVLYRERLSDGGFVVRSERMENKRVQLYDQRRSSIVEGVMSEFQRGLKSFQVHDGENSDDEGAKIFQLLEEAAEPEFLMADMTYKQLNSFVKYKEKIEAIRESEMQKLIEKALDEAGLRRREVNTFMRARVVGLTSRSNNQKSCSRQGMVTIWNPSEEQQSELVEGQAYVVAGLSPVHSNSNIIYLHGGSTTKWQPLSLSTIGQFQPFFSARKSVSLLKMDEIPLSSEFDVAAFVIYVGEVHKSTHHKKQWVFVADGSINTSHSHDQSDTLLAISFCSPAVDCDSIVPINYNLVGSTVGFCNLIKCDKDHTNRIRVAEATENSTYHLSYDASVSKHLKNAAVSADRWAKASTLTIEKLKRKVLSILACKI